MNSVIAFPQALLDTAADNAEKLIADYEKLMLAAYHGRADKPGVWTLGFGQITWNGQPVKPGMTCTEDEARAGLLGVVGIILPKIASAAPAGATAWQLGALTSFAYNEGSGATLGSTLMRKWRTGDVQGAADQFPLWNISDGQVQLGLELRRAAERALFLFA